MLKISKIARHTVIQMAGCTMYPNSSSCPDIMSKMNK